MLLLGEDDSTDSAMLRPRVRDVIILGDIPIDVPQPKYWRGCVPGIPGGFGASV